METVREDDPYVRGLLLRPPRPERRTSSGLVRLGERRAEDLRVDGNVLARLSGARHSRARSSSSSTPPSGTRTATGWPSRSAGRWRSSVGSGPRFASPAGASSSPITPILSIPFEAVGVQRSPRRGVPGLRAQRGTVPPVEPARWRERARAASAVTSGSVRFRSRLPEPSAWNRYSLDVTELFERASGRALPTHVSRSRERTRPTTCPDAPRAASGRRSAAGELRGLVGPGVQQLELRRGLLRSGRGRQHLARSGATRARTPTTATRDGVRRRAELPRVQHRPAREARARRRRAARSLATDLSPSARPLADVRSSTVFNFQDQSPCGHVVYGRRPASRRSSTEAKPFYAVAARGDERGYLKLNSRRPHCPRKPLSTSEAQSVHRRREGTSCSASAESGAPATSSSSPSCSPSTIGATSIPDDHPVTLVAVRSSRSDRTRSADPHVEPRRSLLPPSTMKTAEDAPTGLLGRPAPSVGGIRFDEDACASRP